ncbi:hypothetical protein RI367_005562 [Sorochytrium milnesiophthora]
MQGKDAALGVHFWQLPAELQQMVLAPTTPRICAVFRCLPALQAALEKYIVSEGQCRYEDRCIMNECVRQRGSEGVQLLVDNDIFDIKPQPGLEAIVLSARTLRQLRPMFLNGNTKQGGGGVKLIWTIIALVYNNWRQTRNAELVLWFTQRGRNVLVQLIKELLRRGDSIEDFQLLCAHCETKPNAKWLIDRVVYYTADFGHMEALRWMRFCPITGDKSEMMCRAKENGQLAVIKHLISLSEGAASDGKEAASMWSSGDWKNLPPKQSLYAQTYARQSRSARYVETIKWAVTHKAAAVDTSSMELAVKWNSPEAMQWLFEQDPVCLADYHFSIAVSHGCLQAAQWIWTHRDAMPNANLSRHSPEFKKTAAKLRYVDLLRWLYDVFPVRRGDDNISPGFVKALLAGWVEATPWLPKYAHVYGDKLAQDWQQELAREGRADVLAHLEELGFRHTTSVTGAALEGGNLAWVRLLYKKGDTNRLGSALRSGRLETVKLVASSRKQTARSGYFATAAAAQHNLQVVRWLSQNGYLIRSVSPEVLKKAAAAGHIAVLQFFSRTCSTSETVELLRIAMERGHLDIVDLMYDPANYQHWVAISGCAATDGQLQVFKRLPNGNDNWLSGGLNLRLQYHGWDDILTWIRENFKAPDVTHDEWYRPGCY